MKDDEKRLAELKKQIATLHKIIAPLNNERDKIQDVITERNNRSLIGNCFKTKNRYSSNGWWWLYIKIIGVDGDRIKVLKVQKPDDNDIDISVNIQYPNMIDDYSYIKITPKQFKASLLKIKKSMGI